MQKRAYSVGKELTDGQWNILKPLFPVPVNSPNGGQKRAPNRACLEGILWIFRTVARWKDIPDRFPSAAPAGADCKREKHNTKENIR